MVETHLPVDERGAWYACALMTIAYAMAYMDRSILNLLLIPIEKSFGLSDTAAGLLVGIAFALCWGILAVPLSRIADRGVRRSLIAIGMIVWSLSTLGTGLAPTTPWLFVSRFGVAAGEAVLIPAATSLLADYFAPKSRTRALSVFTMGTYIGSGLSFIIGAFIIKQLAAHPVLIGGAKIATWRIILGVLGILGLAFAPFIWRLREPPRRPDPTGHATANLSIGEAFKAIRRVGSALSAHYAGFATITFANFAVSSWTATIFVRDHGWSISQTGFALGIPPLVMGPLGALTGALLANAFERRGRSDGKFLVGVVAAAGAVVSTFMLTSPSTVVALVGVAAVQFFVSFNYGVLHAALVELLPNRVRALGVALYTVITSSYSISLGPLAVALVSDHIFHDPKDIGLAVRIVAPIAFAIGGAILALGGGAYRKAARQIALATPA